MGLEGIAFSNANKVVKLNCFTVSLALERIGRSVHGFTVDILSSGACLTEDNLGG